MRRGVAIAVVALAVGLVALFVAAPRAQAQQSCPKGTQGAYALALAQVLGYDVTTVEAAVSALDAIGVAPDGGWQPEACLNDAVVAQVRTSLERAVAQGAVPPGIGTGAADRAFSGIGDRDTRGPVSPHQPQ